MKTDDISAGKIFIVLSFIFIGFTYFVYNLNSHQPKSTFEVANEQSINLCVSKGGVPIFTIGNYPPFDRLIDCKFPMKEKDKL
jgi:hypothetical protein